MFVCGWYKIIFLDSPATEGMVIQVVSDVPAKDMGYEGASCRCFGREIG